MKIGIYYPFEPYVGGGEKYTFAMAECLSSAHDVELLATPYERVRELAATLGCDLSAVKVRPRLGYVTRREKLLGSRRYDLFICVSNHSVPPVASLGRRGVLLVQFPFPARKRDWLRVSLLGPLMLRSYSLTLVYSKFVAHWLRERAPFAVRVVILPPPVDVMPADPDAPREPIILAVGRFFEGQHSKRQEDLVLALRSLVDEGLHGWELHLVGATRPEPQHQAYLARVRRLAEGYPVVFHTDAAPHVLSALYRRASLFWHATGHGLDPLVQPEAMEHFGLATVEAMSNGCVPIVHARGGQPEIVRQGVNGFLWETLDELQQLTLEYISAPEETRISWRAAAIEASKMYSRSAFCSALVTIVNRLTSEIGPVAEPARDVASSYPD